jgi:gluconokinase
MKPLLVVMGVTGSGKSTVGQLLASAVGVPFADADDLHPEANVRKMAAGHPLDDEDRWPWLHRVGEELAASGDTGLVIACSALKRSYRDAILAREPRTLFVELDGERELLEQRMQGRRDHFMPLALLDSQLDTLEPLDSTEPGFRVGIDQTPERIVDDIRTHLGAL